MGHSRATIIHGILYHLALIFVSVIGAYDIYLTIAYAPTLSTFEQNPMVRWIMFGSHRLLPVSADDDVNLSHNLHGIAAFVMIRMLSFIAGVAILMTLHRFKHHRICWHAGNILVSAWLIQQLGTMAYLLWAV